jgi:taspase (threonine aspartase 1)
MGVPALPHDALVSEAAKERWIRWHGDLKLAERKARKAGQHPSCWKIREPVTAEDEAEHERLRGEHTYDLMQALTTSPGSGSPTKFEQSQYYTVDDELRTNPSDPSNPNSDFSILSSVPDDRVATPESAISEQSHNYMPARHASIKEASRSAFINSTQKVPTMKQFEGHSARNPATALISQDGLMADVNRGGFHARRSWADGSGEESESTASGTTTTPPQNPEATIPTSSYGALDTTGVDHPQNITLTPTASIPLHSRFDQEDDHITDTVGAIAVDGWGNISCAASSGGIGMKYRGRIGPAALVGVGTSVIPRDPDDLDETCVATVTSGTGEHMATTMAATVCAERIYQSVKKQKGGEYVEVTEDEALRSMIENEFMGKKCIH